MEDHGLDTELLKRFLKKSYHDRKPADITSVEVSLGVPKGDNYGSLVHRVKFDVSTASGRRKKRSIIVKTIAKWTEIFGGEMKLSSPAFRSEIAVYSNTLRLMEELMEEFGDKRSTLWAELLGSRPYNLIAFEDLTETCYSVSPRKNRLNLKQGLLALRSLGRFHAMGKVLISRALLGQEDKGQLTLALDFEFIEKLWNAYFTALSGGMETWGDEWKKISKKILELSGGVNKKWAKLSECYDKRYEVLNHGDLWSCNMLFHNLEFEDIPVSVKFVDFQCTHLNSFIWDVEYFVHSSVIASVRRTNIDLLRTAYQESLEKNLKFFNYSGYIPTLEDVNVEAKRIEFASMCCTLFQPIMMSEVQLNMEKIQTHPPEEALSKSVYAGRKAQEAIGEDLKRFYDSGVMDFGE